MIVLRTIMNKLRGFAAKPTPAKILSAGFIILISLGAFLLWMPFSARNGKSTAFIDAFFTATSAVCVTGLVVVDTNSHWSLIGQIIILLLIQIGALGIMSIVTLFAVFTGKNMGLTQRLAIRDSISHFSLVNIVNTFKRILMVTLVIEGFGALLIAIVLVPQYGWLGGFWRSIFHAISAFCNAGFDIFGTTQNPFASLTEFNKNIFILIITGILIVLGGLGFIVWQDIYVNKKFKKFSLHSKIVIAMTATLLLIGTMGFLAFESNHAFKDLSWVHKITNSLFCSITARTAGFNTVRMENMMDTSNLLTIILMFIGAAPGSTAGGIKVTTIYIVITVHNLVIEACYYKLRNCQS